MVTTPRKKRSTKRSEKRSEKRNGKALALTPSEVKSLNEVTQRVASAKLLLGHAQQELQAVWQPVKARLRLGDGNYTYNRESGELQGG